MPRRGIRRINAPSCVTKLELSPLEIASGVVIGSDPWAQAFPVVRNTPRAAIEQIAEDDMKSGPCFISFSGGRDSASLLALYTHVARKRKMPDPIPITIRYPTIPATDESAWQQLLIDELKISKWEVITVRDELDLVGPVATEQLVRHGVLWPANVHSHIPMMRIAEGATLVTGFDGDGLFGSWRWSQLGDVFARRSPGSIRDFLRLVYAESPRFVREVNLRRKDTSSLPWLTSRAEKTLIRAWLRQEAEEPAQWRRRLKWWLARRYLSVAKESFQTVARDCSVDIRHPFIDPLFVSALGAHKSLVGLGDRTRIIAMLFGDILPQAVILRQDKGFFRDAFWNEHSRALVARWDGTGLDEDLVDVVRLRKIWGGLIPDTRTASLLQSLRLREVGQKGN